MPTTTIALYSAAGARAADRSSWGGIMLIMHCKRSLGLSYSLSFTKISYSSPCSLNAIHGDPTFVVTAPQRACVEAEWPFAVVAQVPHSHGSRARPQYSLPPFLLLLVPARSDRLTILHAQDAQLSPCTRRSCARLSTHGIGRQISMLAPHASVSEARGQIHSDICGWAN